MKPVRLLANCVVGLGFSYRGFQAGLDLEPDVIGCDAGSADFGPYYLGSGRDPKAAISLTRDLSIMIEGGLSRGVPVVIGSCGGAGAAPHVEEFVGLVGAIASRLGRAIRVAAIYSDQPKDRLHAALDANRIHPIGHVPQLTHDAIDSSAAVVAMMGAAPIMAALDEGAEVVLAGRCADPAIFAAPALRLGVRPAVAWHAAKCIDKGYLATTRPQEGSPVLASLYEDHFDIEPTKAGTVCTARTVAMATMHENPDPFRIVQPSGAILTAGATYDQIDTRRVRVTGSGFEVTQPSVKLEGARQVGYRAILFAGIRDPRLLCRLGDFRAEYTKVLGEVAASLGVTSEMWSLRLRLYGNDGVMGEADPDPDSTPKEVGLVVDVVAQSQEIATGLASRAGPTGSRLDVTGRLGGGGNFAYPFSPSVVPMGPVFEWSVWHSMAVDDESEPFRLEKRDLTP